MTKQELDDKVGQLFCAPLSWNEFSDMSEIRTFVGRLVEMGIGGLILYGGDMEGTPELLRDLVDSEENPLLVMADVERGTAQQIEGGTEFPTMMAIGASRSVDLARKVGKATALESKCLGINVLLAPVLDVNTNPFNPIISVRAFGESPTLVAELGAAYTSGCQEAGAIATAKHFPGHGDTDLDSHLTLPVVRRGPESLKKLELTPFKKAISEGVLAVMVGHISIPAVTGSENLPASLSKKVVTGILRTEFGFDGLVMSDAMIMDGVLGYPGEKDPVIEALKAGIDMLVYVDDVQRAIENVRKALEDGSLDPSIVEKAVQRVSNARGYLASPARYPASGQTVGSSEHRKLAGEVADSAATLVRNRAALFPISPDEKGVFVIYEDDKRGYEMILPRLLQEAFPGWPLISLDQNGQGLSGEEVEQIEGAEKSVIFVFSSIRAWRGVADLSPGGRRIVESILQVAGRAGLISLGSPYMMRYYPGIDGYICLYSHAQVSQESALKVIRGDLNPSGRLPVSIPGLYPYDWGISYDQPGG